MSERVTDQRFRTYDPATAVEMLPGVSRTMLTAGQGAMAVRIEAKKGGTVPLHTHPHEQIGFLVSGRASLQVGDEVRELRPGDGYSIPGGVPHAVTEVAEDSVFMDIFSPPREDYRQ
ncbi:MAG: cupin domain-containing protein [Chloroflexi bacterium]|nr:cupin domain-containing protein [Chloroflexota bacterium]